MAAGSDTIVANGRSPDRAIDVGFAAPATAVVLARPSAATKPTKTRVRPAMVHSFRHALAGAASTLPRSMVRARSNMVQRPVRQRLTEGARHQRCPIEVSKRPPDETAQPAARGSDRHPPEASARASIEPPPTTRMVRAVGSKPLSARRRIPLIPQPPPPRPLVRQRIRVVGAHLAADVLNVPAGQRRQRLRLALVPQAQHAPVLIG